MLTNHRPLIALALSLSACAVEPDLYEGAEEVESVSQASCRTCDPGTSNDRGVIAEEGGNACLETLDHGTVCPLAILNDPGSVKIRVRAPDNSVQWTRNLSATYNGSPITLKSVTANETSVAVVYAGPWGVPVSVTGANLSNIVFSFKLTDLDQQSILLSLNGIGESPRLFSGIYLQNLRYRFSNTTAPWSFLCTDHNGAEDPASLYTGAWFDPMSGQRLDNSGVTQISCHKGAITACMEWNYKPWKSANHVQQGWQSLEDAHVACIQMKRAAYCGTDSYTKHGTPIARDDAYGLHDEIGVNPLEAVWSPGGAVCLNMGNRRHPEMIFGGSCNGAVLQACPAQESSWWSMGGLTANAIYLP